MLHVWPRKYSWSNFQRPANMWWIECMPQDRAPVSDGSSRTAIQLSWNTMCKSIPCHVLSKGAKLHHDSIFTPNVEAMLFCVVFSWWADLEPCVTCL